MTPAGRPEVEVHGGITPGYYLSSAVTRDADSAGLRDLGAAFEPDRLLGVRGVFVGARYAGSPSAGASVEPQLGYRVSLGADQRWGLGVVAFGTHAHGSDNRASFTATRGGLEAGADVRLTPASKWLELHLDAGFALTGLSARGSYCVDEAGIYGVDCPVDAVTLVNADVGGLYPSLNTSFALDFARHEESALHGVRLAFGAAGGTMPRVIAGEQRSARLYAGVGATLSLAFGAVR